MLHKKSLHPEHRTLYGANLQPPAGYTFDAAVATTFSLDFETALAVPVSLALFASEDREVLLANPLALIEGAERAAGRLLIFTDAGRIQTDSQPKSRLCALLERMVVEVEAPNGGAFHPKMWALRFTPLNPVEPVRTRLLVLSRNLTRDRSWDTSLALDGVVTGRSRASNKQVADLIRRLPGLAVGGVGLEARKLAESVAADLVKSNWELPEPFESVDFAVNGLDRKTWQPEECARLGVISPFCDESALGLLADRSRAKPVLIGRVDELAAISPDILGRFERIFVLDELVVDEDGEEHHPCQLQGLHAKVYVGDQGWDTAITVGSGNATCAALTSRRNVELFATLIGKRSKVGTVEEIFGSQGIGRMTREFIAGEVAAPDPTLREAEKSLDNARREICRSNLSVHCEASPSGEGPLLWHLSLAPGNRLQLADVQAAELWPITRGETHSCDVLPALRSGASCDVGVMPLMDLTRFFAFKLTHSHGEQLLFSTAIEVEGMPADRDTAVLRWIIDSKEAFFRYLRLLLADSSDPFAAAISAGMGMGAGAWTAGADDVPLLEEMVKAFCRGGDHLQAIERLITRLEGDGGDADPVPTEFRVLWKAFQAARDNGESGSAEV